MKTLSGTLILILSLYFTGCATQTGSSSTSSAPGISENSAPCTPESSSQNTSDIEMVDEGDTGPDAPDSEIE